MPADHVRGHGGRGALLRRHAGVRRHRRAARPRARPRGRRARASRRARRRSAPSTTAATRPTSRRCATLCDDAGMALIEDAAHSPSADAVGDAASSAPRPGRLLLVLLQQGALLRRGRPARHRRRRGRRAGAQPALARDDVRHLGPPPRPRARLRRASAWATTTAWTSRARRCCSRGWRGLEDDIAERRRELVHRYRELLADVSTA